MIINTHRMAGIAALIVCLSGPAAADGYVSPKSLKDAPSPCCEANWNGVYIGVALGWGSMVAGQDDDWGPGPGITPFHNEHEFGSDGILGVLRIGLDRKIMHGIVIGAFADYEFHDLGFGGRSTNGRRTKEYIVAGNRFSRDVDANSGWAVGARLGLARDCCTMWYSTIGYTQTEIEFDFKRNDVDILGTKKSTTFGGLFVGGGVEQQLGRGWALALEYRYAMYEDKLIFSGFHDGSGGILAYHDEKLFPNIHSVRLGLSYKFDVHGHRAVEPLK